MDSSFVEIDVVVLGPGFSVAVYGREPLQGVFRLSAVAVAEPKVGENSRA
jgi:hypothetical protein